MGKIQINQIRKALERNFLEHIDLSDIRETEQQKLEQAGLTRALAAFAISKSYGISPEEACACVIDGRDDNGIDAVAFIESPRPRLVICQSKWSDKGASGANLEAIIKLKEGISLLVSEKWERFNSRLRARSLDLSAALEATDLKIDVIFVSMGVNDLSADLSSNIGEYLSEEFNDGVEQWDAAATASFKFLKQIDVYSLLSTDQAPSPIDVNVQVSDWGRIDEPYSAVYGHVSGNDVAKWLIDGGTSLLSGNVRFGLGYTAANARIEETARKHPELFWYFNNGITILCDSITKAPAGGSDRRVGTFEFKNVSLVNGAQTASTLVRSIGNDTEFEVPPRIMVRFISLEGAPADFGQSVTRATNTQNAIGGRDFAALDAVQGRLKAELAIEGFQYVLKRGEELAEDAVGCDLQEAAIALASLHSAELATQAKREIGKFWDDITKSPYTEIFSPSVTHVRLQRAVELTRRIDEEIDALKPKFDAREKSYAVHGNRLLTFIIASRIIGDLRHIDALSDPEWSAVIDAIESRVYPTLTELIEAAEGNYGGYTAALFKNKSKTQHLSELLAAKEEADSQLTAISS